MRIIVALDTILEDQPDTILALIPHGAGKAVNVNAPSIVKDCQDFLRALAFDENRKWAYNTQIHPPDRVFAVSKTISFTIYELDNKECTWDIFPIVSMAVENCLSHEAVLEQKATILSTIKGDLQHNPDYCRFAGKTGYVNLGHTGDLNDILRTLSDTFHLERTEAENDKGDLVPAYVLMARPPSQNATDFASWRSFFVKNERGQLRESFCGALQHFNIGVLPSEP
ncbi:hypothetical protein GY45DRAFT_1376349 [Cubamyces sp. BRFM 1775]|nr:hypothetical protein GY45DRAFT_1376349 [Cubamyces sp. BRFM 1775]